MRERITGFPVIPSTSLKGVLLQRGREIWETPHATGNDLPEQAKILFGGIDETKNANGEKRLRCEQECRGKAPNESVMASLLHRHHQILNDIPHPSTTPS